MISDTTYGKAAMPGAYWGWFTHRESFDPAFYRDWFGGTYVVSLCNVDSGPFKAFCSKGAVVDDFGDLVPVRRPQ